MCREIHDDGYFVHSNSKSYVHNENEEKEQERERKRKVGTGREATGAGRQTLLTLHKTTTQIYRSRSVSGDGLIKNKSAG